MNQLPDHFGGVADARGISGDQAIDSSMFPDHIGAPVTLLLGAGVFTVPATSGYGLEVPSNFSLVGLGWGKTILRLPPNADAWTRIVGTVLGATNITIASLELDGSRSGNTSSIVQNHAIVLLGASHVNLNQLYIHDTNGDGISLWGGSSDVTVQNNLIVNTNRAGVAVISAENCTIRNNAFQNDTEFDQIHFEPDDASEVARYITVENNVINTTGVIGGISITAPSDAGENVGHNRVANNTIMGGHLWVQRTPYTDVVGNVIKNSNDDVPVLVRGRDIVFDSNKVEGTNLPAARATVWSAGIMVAVNNVANTSGQAFPNGRNRIVNNQVTGVRGVGIYVLNASYNVLQGNVISNVQPNVSGTAFGMLVQDTVQGTTDNTVTGNQAIDNQLPPTQRYGFLLAPGVTNTTFTNNVGSGNIVANVVDFAVNTRMQ